MKARLLCKFGEMKGSEFDIGAEATVGRSESSSIVLPSSSVSGEHARIFYDGEAGHYVLEDLDSLNGTEVDGMPVRGKQALGPLHVVTFGKVVEFIFVASVEPAADGGSAPPVVEGEDEIRATTLVDAELPPLPAGLEVGERLMPPATEDSVPEVTAIELAVVDLPAALVEGGAGEKGAGRSAANDEPAEGPDDGG